MRKLLLTNLCILISSILATSAQTVTDANGSRTYRANIAVIVKESIFSFENGKFVHSVSDADKSLFGAAVNAYVIKCLQDEGFRVVNRDNEVYAEIQDILRENKLEDYLKGYSVQAKGQGADWILLVDLSLFNRNNYVTTDFSYRFINVQNNGCVPAKLQRSQTITSDNDMTSFVQTLIRDNGNFFLDYMRRQFPAMFSIIETKGNNVTLAAIQPIGAIREGEKIYIYEYSKGEGTVQDIKSEYDILNLISVTDKYSLDKRGYLVANVGTSIKNPNSTVVSLSARNALVSESYYPITYADMDYDENTYDGYIRKMINQAMYEALGADHRFYVIESSLLDEVKNERELQKTEEFIDGHTVEQFKAIGAQDYVRISDVVINESNETVTFNVNLYQVESNTLSKTIPCNTTVSGILSSVKGAVSKFFITPCDVLDYNKKEIEIFSPIGLWANNEQKFYLAMAKEMKNPINGETSYQRINIASLKYSEYKGMQHSLIIDEIIDKEAMNNINEYIGKTNFSLVNIYNDETPKYDEVTDKGEEKGKKEKKGGFGKFLKNVGDVLLEASSANSMQQPYQGLHRTHNKEASKFESNAEDEINKISNELAKIKFH